MLRRSALVWLIFFAFGFLGVSFASSQNGHAKSLGYSVQVGSFKQLENAGRLSENLNKKGLDAFFFKEGGNYKVRFGNFKSYDLAKSKATENRKLGLIGDFFIIYPQSYKINKQTTQKVKNHDVRASLVKDAHSYLGTPYKWGGDSSSGFDCSGLARAVYRLSGMDLPRVSQEQFNAGKAISPGKLQEGDLVFFITNNGKKINHVGIYIGNNEFIHAPGTGKKVSKARLDNVYWKKVYKGAKSYF